MDSGWGTHSFYGDCMSPKVYRPFSPSDLPVYVDKPGPFLARSALSAPNGSLIKSTHTLSHTHSLTHRRSIYSCSVWEMLSRHTDDDRRPGRRTTVLPPGPALFNHLVTPNVKGSSVQRRKSWQASTTRSEGGVTTEKETHPALLLPRETGGVNRR
ncbi:uncharacterized protein LY79DRAFT_557322 [Colletotrichum navitas]|uniref:Uncharacterized protein n=1 Tax=Colletotrichum navitas TaxID=681940 RepID=A0AAD8PXP3_9PEZI|nr:uncharacterized protein LY79DRAFT_557322 [Colletotrichum navitas]KAK1586035.1 hypothetical protein LY79DRAFT_557322 [Colletotrichum navitas]